MPNDTAISIRGLSKAYTIWHDQVKHSTLAEQVLHPLRHPFSAIGGEIFSVRRSTYGHAKG